jgi:hypothetical protein
MKNVHLISTDKPSRLRYNLSNQLVLIKDTYRVNYDNEVTQHIFITSDEEIKEGDWVITPTNDIIQWAKVFRPDGKKIIITTDQDLIAEGIQPIDDTFLEWFVNNPSCEFVDVRYEVLKPFQSVDKGYMIHLPDNEVLGEPKQGTVEEAAKYQADRMISEEAYEDALNMQKASNAGYESKIAELEAQIKEMYSKDEVLKILLARNVKLGIIDKTSEVEEWFNRFKKK